MTRGAINESFLNNVRKSKAGFSVADAFRDYLGKEPEQKQSYISQIFGIKLQRKPKDQVQRSDAKVLVRARREMRATTISD